MTSKMKLQLDISCKTYLCFSVSSSVLLCFWVWFYSVYLTNDRASQYSRLEKGNLDK